MSDNSLKLQLLYNSRKKNMVVAYLLGFLLGGFGVHYFYCGKNDYGLVIIALLVLTLFTGGATMFVHGIAVLIGVVHTYFVVEDMNKVIYQECKIMVGED